MLWIRGGEVGKASPSVIWSRGPSGSYNKEASSYIYRYVASDYVLYAPRSSYLPGWGSQ